MILNHLNVIYSFLLAQAAEFRPERCDFFKRDLYQVQSAETKVLIAWAGTEFEGLESEYEVIAKHKFVIVLKRRSEEARPSLGKMILAHAERIKHILKACDRPGTDGLIYASVSPRGVVANMQTVEINYTASEFISKAVNDKYSYQASPSIPPPPTFSFLNAFSLDGINDGFSRASVSTFNGLNKLDISTWVYIDPTAAVNQALINWFAPSAPFNDGFQLVLIYVSSGVFKVRYAIYPSNGAAITYGETGNLNLTGARVNIVGKYDGTQSTNATKLRIKVNDVAQSLTFSGTIPTAMGSETMSLVFGRNIVSTTFVKGKICHTAFKHGTWSDAEDTAHYASGNGAEYASYDEYWSGNSTPNDAGVNALHLTAENGATYAAF